VSPVKFTVIPPPKILQEDVECFRIFEYTGHEAVAIKVAPIAVPGIVFQQKDGKSAIENIIVRSEVNSSIPTAYVYGPGIEPSVMTYKKGPHSTVQVIFKPHALKTLLGIDASLLTNKVIELNDFSDEDLNSKLIEANSDTERVTLLTNFLITKVKQTRTRDRLVEESLDLIHKNIASIDVKYLLKNLHISVRQFEKRFTDTVGVSPLSYIRVRRFNEAIRLMKTGQFDKLTDVAHALNFYDQSHFIRDLKEFSGITPKSILQKVEDFHEQGGFSYV
jgi:AraC-like DNA-binding protein